MSKFKGKVGIAAVVAVTVLVLLVYVLVVLPLDKQIRAAAREDVKRGAALVKDWQVQHSYDLVAVARHGANQAAFVKAIQVEDASKRRQDVFDAISVYDDQLKTKRRKADFLCVVDEQGKVIARDLNIQDMFGEKLPYGAIAHALAGRATSDILVMKNRMMRAAAAPIYVGAELKGALVVAYDLTDAEANAERHMANAQVLYFNAGAVRAASFPKAGAEVRAVNDALLKAGTPVTKAVAAGKVETFETEIGGNKYVGMAGPLAPPVTVYGGKTKPGKAMQQTSAAKSDGAGFIVLANVTQRLARVTTTRWALLVFWGLLLLFVTAVMWAVAKQYIDGQDKLELGVSEVISGNSDYSFETEGKLAPVAHKLNAMLALLLDRPAPGKSSAKPGSTMASVVAAIAVVAIVTAFYLIVALPLAKDARQGAAKNAEHSAEMVQGWLRQHAFALTALARQGANNEALVSALGSEDAAKRAQDVVAALGQLSSLGGERGKADLLAVVDAQGQVVAPKSLVGQKIGSGAIAQALAGRATSDIWLQKDALLRGAAAPIYVNGEVKGAVVLGHAFKDASAKAEQKMANTEIVYFAGGKVQAASLSKSGLDALEAQVSQASAAGKLSKTFATQAPGGSYVAVAGPLAAPVTIYGGKEKGGAELAKNSVGAQGTGFVVLAALGPRLASVTKARWVLLGFLIVLLLFVLAMIRMVSKHFCTAQELLEEGINEVNAGNVEYTFDALEEFEGLANALNVMLARLLGRPEPGEEEDGDQAWRPDVITIDELAQPSGDEGQLAGESDEAYHARLFDEYLAARKAADLSVEGITAAVFTQRVKSNAAMLRAQHEAQKVRFTVQSAGGRVTLRPLRLG